MGSYVSFWTIVLWVAAGGFGLFAVLGIWAAFAAPNETPKGRREVLGGSFAALLIAAMLFGVGHLAKGSVAERNLKEAIAAENKAKQDLQDLNYEQCGRPVCPGGAFGY